MVIQLYMLGRVSFRNFTLEGKLMEHVAIRPWSWGGGRVREGNVSPPALDPITIATT